MYAEMIQNETSESCILSVLYKNIIYKNILKLGNVLFPFFWVKEANASGHIISPYIAFQVATYSLRQYD